MNKNQGQRKSQKLHVSSMSESLRRLHKKVKGRLALQYLQCKVCEELADLFWANKGWVALWSWGYTLCWDRLGGSCRVVSFFLSFFFRFGYRRLPQASVSTGTFCNSCQPTWLIETLIRVSLLCFTRAGAVNNRLPTLWHFETESPQCVLLLLLLLQTFTMPQAFRITSAFQQKKTRRLGALLQT